MNKVSTVNVFTPATEVQDVDRFAGRSSEPSRQRVPEPKFGDGSYDRPPWFRSLGALAGNGHHDRESVLLGARGPKCVTPNQGFA
jgi:hypothetical protein